MRLFDRKEKEEKQELLSPKKLKEKIYPAIHLADYASSDTACCAWAYGSQSAWMEEHCKKIIAGRYTAVAFWTTTLRGKNRQYFSQECFTCILEKLISQPHYLKEMHFWGCGDADTKNFVAQRLLPAIRENPRQLEQVMLENKICPRTWETIEIEEPFSACCVLL